VEHLLLQLDVFQEDKIRNAVPDLPRDGEIRIVIKRGESPMA